MEILNRLRQGIRISEDPFGELAKEMGIEKKELIDEILKLRDEKIIKGMRVLLDQNALGYKVNALIAMRMEECECEYFLKNPNISHFYKRKPDKDFPYNFYAMVHCPTEKCLNDILLYLNEKNIPHVVMRTIKNLKGDDYVFTNNVENN
ncbi:MAG: hypothetical protein QXL95_03910 [Thermoplasmata archaeon]